MKSAKQPKKTQVIRRAFTLRLKPGSFAKYKYYHDNIWPELVREVEDCGIAQITTFENKSSGMMPRQLRVRSQGADIAGAVDAADRADKRDDLTLPRRLLL